MEKPEPNDQIVHGALRGNNSGADASKVAALWLQTIAEVTAGDIVELQDNFQTVDGNFAADQTLSEGAKVG